MQNKLHYRTGEFALTKREYARLLEVCGNQEDRVLIMLGVSLGLRRTDISRIKLANINFNEHTLTYLEKKKGDRIRTVPMGPKLEQEIRILMKTLPKNQDTLFSIKDRQIYNRFNNLCEIAGIPRRPIHSLRATCIKFCQQAGWTPEQVAELTGDKIRTIQEHYATPSQAEMRELMRDNEVV